MLAGGIVYVSFEIFLRIIVLSHTEIINSHTDRTDLTDLYLTRRILVIAHTESTESTETIGSAAQRTNGRCQRGKANSTNLVQILQNYI